MNTLRAGGCVVVLGDDSQGIFQFSGACDQTLRALKERVRAAGIPVKRFSLMQNHRSTNSIVAAAESLLPFHDRANRIGVCGNGTVGDPVEASLFKSESAEAEAVAARAVELVAGGQFAADQIVILRHKNWTWGHQIVQQLRQLSAARGVEINVAIAGQDATNSLEGKFLAVLQVGIDMERFCEPATEGLDMIKAFVKSMRGKGWNQKLGFRAIETVYQRHISSDPAAIFTRYREELLSEFRLEEAKDDAEQAEKEARKGGGGAKRKRVIATGGPTMKEKNFESVIRVCGKAITGIRERVRGIEQGKRTLDPIVVTPQIDFFARDKSKPPEDIYPTLNTPLGGLAWLILRDVVAHEYSAANAFQIQEIVSKFDFEFENGSAEDLADVVSEPVSKMAAKVHDKSTQGKLVLSTIHKYKGRENEVAFVCALSNPWGSPDWPRRATLSSEHTHDCTNRSGQRTECCGPFKQGIDRLKAAQTSEKLRLFYVGASRAKQRLFLSGFESLFGDSFQPVFEMTGGYKGVWKKVGVR
jgi:superfamily I DNA/RNA helicase